MNSPIKTISERTSKFKTHTIAQQKIANSFNYFYSRGEIDALIQFLESSFTTFPLQRRFLIQAYDQLFGIGNTNLANEIGRIYVDACKLVSDNGTNNLGLPLILNNLRMSTSLTEMVNQTAYANVAQKLNHISTKPQVSQFNDYISPQTQAFLPYFLDTFAVSGFEKRNRPAIEEWLKIQEDMSPFQAFFYKYTDTQYGHTGNFFTDCHEEITSANIKSSPFQLKGVTTFNAMRFLSRYDFKQDDDFVVLYLNEEQNTESVPLDTKLYISSIEYLLNMGFKVIRIGNKNMTPMLYRPGFIDLTQVDRPGEVDIFLCASAKFYFGSLSAAYSLSSTFGTPCCLTSVLPYGPIRINDFIQNLQFRDINTQAIPSISKIKEYGLCGATQVKHFKSFYLRPDFPNSAQNTKLVQEMVEYHDKNEIFHLNNKYQKEKEKNKMWGGMCSETLSLFVLQ